MPRFAIYILLCCQTFLAVAGNDTVTHSDLNKQLERLENELLNRDRYLEQRRRSIDSLAVRASDTALAAASRAEAMLRLGDALNSFDSEWALKVYNEGLNIARNNSLNPLDETFQLRMATFLPLSGYFEDAINRYNSIDTTGMSTERKIEYFDTGRQMYNYIASFHASHPADSERYMLLSRRAQEEMLPLLDPSSNKYKLNLGEHYFFENQYVKADAILSDLISNLDEADNIYARASHIMSDIALARGRKTDHLYLLTLSAIADTKAATREVASLQELGAALFEYDNIERAHNFLSTALRNAVECNAPLRMIQSAQAIPFIEQAHLSQLKKSRYITYGVIVLLAIILVLLIATMWVLYKKIQQMNGLTAKLGDANKIKDIYINEFLNLCSVYIEKLHKLSNLVHRKLTTGKSDDLLQLTKSGKLVEEQTDEFYTVFDEAFLNLYPRFVESVNSLLRPDCRIEPSEAARLNTDLRILAFMRLGISESNRIAQLLNYSVHTIYAYRNKLKNRAISRDTFEDDIMRIPSISEAGESA